MDSAIGMPESRPAARSSEEGESVQEGETAHRRLQGIQLLSSESAVFA
jgi:hypothetical protein